MKNVKMFEIIKGPIITEKSNALREQHNRYTFKVSKNANKVEIKKAIKTIYKVDVEDVKTINVLPKKKTVNRHTGYTPGYKKAICKLAPGQKIDSFDI